MRVTEKGQVTIPIEIREQLGIGPGTEVDFAPGPNEGEAVLKVRKVEGADRRVMFRAWLDRIEGAADAGLSADQILDMTRGPERRE